MAVVSHCSPLKTSPDKEVKQRNHARPLGKHLGALCEIVNTDATQTCGIYKTAYNHTICPDLTSLKSTLAGYDRPGYQISVEEITAIFTSRAPLLISI